MAESSSSPTAIAGFTRIRLSQLPTTSFKPIYQEPKQFVHKSSSVVAGLVAIPITYRLP